MLLNGTKLVSIACGGNSSSTVDSKGHLYTWGSNSNGQLAAPTQYEIITFPRLVAQLENKGRLPLDCNDIVLLVVRQVAVGIRHMGLVTVDGEVWTWGCNEYAQLGQDGYLQLQNAVLLINLQLGHLDTKKDGLFLRSQ